MASTLAVDSIIYPSRAAAVEELAPPSTHALVRASLIAVLLAAPLAFGAVQPWAWGALAVLAFSLFLIWSIAGTRQGGLRIYWSPLYVPAGLFFLLVTLQFAGHLTMDRLATRESLLKLATDLIFFFLAHQLFSAAPEKMARALGPTLVVYAFMLSLFAIFQFFSSQGLIYWVVKGPGWTFGPYVNHNHYAGLMEMLIPLSVASVLPALRRNASALLLGFVVLIPIASLLLSGSRGGFISLVVEVVLAAALVFFWGPRGARRPTALLGGAALLAAALLFFWMAPRHIAERLATMQDATHHPEVELGGRLVAARDSLGILREHPWLGAGLGSFETAFPPHQSFPTDSRWDHAHNDYAEAIAETGLAGGALVLSALGMFLWLGLRGVRSDFRTPMESIGLQKSESQESGVRRRSRESGILNLESGIPSRKGEVLALKEVVSHQSSVISRREAVDGRLHTAYGPAASATLSPVPSPEPRVPNPVPRIPSTVYRLPSTVYRLPSTVYCLRLAAGLGCCGLLVHSFVDFNLHIPANAAWFAVCVALATGRSR
jgi:O-antigen ligase